MKVFWDFDGTIVDHRMRLYKLFCGLTDCNMTYEDYWLLKKEGYKQRDMLEFVGVEANKVEMFKAQWLKMIEKREWLLYDILMPDIKEVLVKFHQKGIKQYIITNRQSIEGVFFELNRLLIDQYFEDCFTTSQKCKKYEKLSECINCSSYDYIIGDSKEDIDSANQLKMKSIVIYNNLYEIEEIKKWNPMYIVNSCVEILDIIYSQKN